MPQVLVKVPLDKWVHAVNFARRTNPLVNANLHPEGAIAVKIAVEYRRLYPVAGRAARGQRACIEEFYSKHCHLRLAKDGNKVMGGFIVLSGELMCLWNIKRGNGDWMIRDALSLGADKLDHFAVPHLVQLYVKHGFGMVLSEPNHNLGGPDVHWRRLQA